MPLTPEESHHIQTTLLAARQGGASMRSLALAHDLAAREGMSATLAELREHIHRASEVPGVNGKRMALAVGLGVASGFITHFLLTGMGQKERD